VSSEYVPFWVVLDLKYTVIEYTGCERLPKVGVVELSG
jgi:hypothetical protein